MTSASYPEWVMKYKSKGVYVNKVGNTYYLYRAHCVYNKDTGKNRRVSDGYIGRVTEEDGFIPVRDKVQGAIDVYEYGLFYFLAFLLKDTYKSLSRNKYRDSIMALAILRYLNAPDYGRSGLFHIYKNSDEKHFVKDTVISEAGRISHMLEHYIATRVTDTDWSYLKTALSSIHLVSVNDKYYVSSYSEELKNVLKKYKVEVK